MDFFLENLNCYLPEDHSSPSIYSVLLSQDEAALPDGHFLCWSILKVIMIGTTVPSSVFVLSAPCPLNRAQWQGIFFTGFEWKLIILCNYGVLSAVSSLSWKAKIGTRGLGIFQKTFWLTDSSKYPCNCSISCLLSGLPDAMFIVGRLLVSSRCRMLFLQDGWTSLALFHWFITH